MDQVVVSCDREAGADQYAGELVELSATGVILVGGTAYVRGRKPEAEPIPPPGKIFIPMRLVELVQWIESPITENNS